MHRNPSVTSAFKTYYENVLSTQHNNTALIGRWGADPSRFETQIMCHKHGTPVPDSQKFEADGEVFGPMRWPYNSDTEPNYSDPPIQFNIATRLKAIGTSWWDWKNKRSIGVGFDFDSLIDHPADTVGIDQSEIDKLDKLDIPWIEIIRSTRGNGRHIYIWFDPANAPITQNHVEHSAIARSFLPLLAEHTGLDIDMNVDCKGLIMWIHHVNATRENRGYECIKPATQNLTADHVPPNWRDNLEVVSGSRSRVRVQGWTADGSQTKGDELDDMTQAYSRVELDETHLKILEALEGTGHTCLWVHDHHLWQGHTGGLKKVYEDFAERGTPLRGLFDTNSGETDPGKPNCICADTQVITRQGLKPIGELAGKDVEIITARGAWATAPFKSYGVQDVYAVTLRRGDDTRVIKATRDHRWYVCKYRSSGYRKTKVHFGERKEVVTTGLEPGQILVQTKPRLVVKPSVIGIQHGLVWGDGTNGGARKTSSLSLFGEKDAQLLKYFSEHPQRPIDRPVGGVEVWNLPYHFKSLVPLDYDLPYLYGWVAGYFAADGCVSDSGACIIRSADEDSIKHVRDVCHILGIETSQISSAVRGSSSYKPGSVMFTTVLKAADLTEDFFLVEQHRERWASTTNRQHSYWRVESVEPAGSEEVFCCTVPETHCFCLEDFILIGNCFMRPKPNGAWDVYRFGEGTGECSLWDTQGKWTHIMFNYPATLRQICVACGGYEAPKAEKGFLFDDLEGFKQAVEMLGGRFSIPAKADKREVALRMQGKKVVATVEKKNSDEKSDFKGWSKGTGVWERVLADVDMSAEAQAEEEKLWADLDNKVRALKVVERGGEFDSWAMFDESQNWTTQPRENIKSYLTSLGYGKPDAIIGGAVFKSWTLTNEPFGPEYPGGRKWNRNAVQFVYQPVTLEEGQEPTHPTWNRLLEHCGVELNEYIPDLPWCRDWGITTGGQYLLAWVACMVQKPYCKLPYLFMYGPQNSGKSSFHESLSLLFTTGVEKADRALTSSQGYNGELRGVILAVIDEVNVNKTGPEVYNKLKEWVTGETFAVHAKYKQVATIKSTLHFVQVANERSALPVFPGDTRITAMNVPPLEEEIPRDLFREKLRAEAPHFMRTLLDFEIQPPTGRLALPIIITQGKLDAENVNTDELNQFIEERCYKIPGSAIKFADFYARFIETVEDHLKSNYSKRLVKQRVSEMFPIGEQGAGAIKQAVIGNLTLNGDTAPSKEWVKMGPRLVKRKEENE